MSAVALLIASSFGKQKRFPCKTIWGNNYGATLKINAIGLLVIEHVSLAETAILPAYFLNPSIYIQDSQFTNIGLCWEIEVPDSRKILFEYSTGKIFLISLHRNYII